MPTESKTIENTLPSIFSNGLTTELEVFLIWLNIKVDSLAVLLVR